MNFNKANEQGALLYFKCMAGIGALVLYRGAIKYNIPRSTDTLLYLMC